MTKPIKVMFDIDGVLADFTSGFTKQAKKIIPEWPDYTTETVPSWDWGGLFNTPAGKQVWAKVAGMADFHRTLPPLVDPGTFARINALCDAVEVYFVTDRKNTAQVKQATEDWLRAQGITNPTVVLTKWKADFASAVGITHAIDDKPGNVLAIYYGTKGATKAFVPDRKYNRIDQTNFGTNIIRIGSVGEFLDAVHRDLDAELLKTVNG